VEFTIPRQVQFAAKEFAAIDGIVDGDIRLTFAEVGEQVLDVAGAFVAAGLQPGERVAVWAPNMAEWVLGAMGALSAGAILVPLNTRYKGMEAADILQRSKATILLTSSGDWAAIRRSAVARCFGVDVATKSAHAIVPVGASPRSTIVVRRSGSSAPLAFSIVT